MIILLILAYVVIGAYLMLTFRNKMGEPLPLIMWIFGMATWPMVLVMLLMTWLIETKL